MDRKQTRSKFKPLLLGVALAPLLLATTAGQSAAIEDDAMIQNYPGTFCFNYQAALAPINASQVYNPTGTPRKAFCPFVTDFFADTLWLNFSAIGGVTCELRISELNGTGWMYNPTVTYHNPGYDTTAFDIEFFAPGGAALECTMNPASSLVEYRVYQRYWDVE
jgi:hypothetical protein